MRKDHGVSPNKHKADEVPNSGHESSKKIQIVSAKEIPVSKGKTEPVVVRRDSSPQALSNKEAEEKKAQQAIKLLEQKKIQNGYGSMVSLEEEKKAPLTPHTPQSQPINKQSSLQKDAVP